MRLACLTAGILLLLSIPARAQQAVQRTIQDYDLELGAKYVFLREEGGYSGTGGFLVEGGWGFWTLKRWRVSAIAEFMTVRFDDFDATYKQGAFGGRVATMLTPKIRVFGQFQVGAQNDGFLNSSTGTVIMPGGGVNYALAGRLDLQAMLDLPFVRYDNGTFKQVRTSVGIAVPLGGR
jgi:hypothetical protein